MKKIVSLLLIVAMVAAMAAGCAKNPAEPTDGTAESTGEATTEATTEATGEATDETTEATDDAVVEDTTAPAEPGSLASYIDSIVAETKLDLMAGMNPLDLTDTSENGLWAVKYNTGLDDASKLKEATVYEAMIGSMAFSMVLVRVNDAAEAKTVAESMKSGINPRKWVCVEANDLKVAGAGDVVMLIMVDTELGYTAQQFVDAFKNAVGTELDFTI